jgi:hypothetical protein
MTPHLFKPRKRRCLNLCILLVLGAFCALNTAPAATTTSPATATNPDADFDADTLTDEEELARGTLPKDMDKDSDNDDVPDNLDGWPRTPWLSPPILSEVRYAVISLRAFGLDTETEVLGIDDANRVLGYYTILDDYY